MRLLPLCLLSSLLSLPVLAQSSPNYEVEVQPTQVQSPSGRWTQDPEPVERDPAASPTDPTPYGSETGTEYTWDPDPYSAPTGEGAPAPGSGSSLPVVLPSQLEDDEPRPSLYPSEAVVDAASAQPDRLAEPLTNSTHVDGHRRLGSFLAGPGSLDFILHHTVMGAAGGLAITGIPGRFDLGDVGTRTTMLLGTLAGASLGFATSAWYQFNNWIEHPAAHYGIIHSMVGAMFLTGLVDTFSDDPLVLASTAIIGAEIAAWMSMVLGTGKLSSAQGLMLSSGAAWGLAYAGLLVAIMATSGTDFQGVGDFLPALLIAPGIGLGAAALALTRYTPSVDQLVRANLFGAGVGSGVLLITALAAGGFTQPLPYVLGLVSSAAAMSLVTLLWAEPSSELGTWTPTGRREPKQAYSNPWW